MRNTLTVLGVAGLLAVSAVAFAGDVGADKVKTSPYMGGWSGSVWTVDVDGNKVEDIGDWRLMVDKKGKASGSVTVNVPNFRVVTQNFKGNINSKGKFNVAKGGLHMWGFFVVGGDPPASGLWTYEKALMSGVWDGTGPVLP